MRRRNTLSTAGFALLICSVSTILTVDAGLSNAVLGATGTRSVPYDQGSSEDLPSAAARICDLTCSSVYGGCSYTFKIEVFETSWKSIYAIQIIEVGDAFMEPLSWPSGWTAQKIPRTLNASNTTVFSTETDPIEPGTVLGRFAIVSYSASITFRWFPADQEGMLVGKTSRVELGCATGAEAKSWGSIKALYR